MTNILALYRGRTVAEVELVAVTAESGIVDRFLDELTGEGPLQEPREAAPAKPLLAPVPEAVPPGPTTPIGEGTGGGR